MSSAGRWVSELEHAIPRLAVVPHMRVRTINQIQGSVCRGKRALQLENVAMMYSHGKLSLYITFVQQLLAEKVTNVEAFRKYCQKADSSQPQLSNINIKRDNLVKKLSEAKFSCPEVPETEESSRRCPKCKGTDLNTVARQTRSADEGQTIFYICNNKKCGQEFR